MIVVERNEHRRPVGTMSLMSVGEYEAAVAAFIRTKGVTRCPTACVVPTQATIAAADREALHRRWAESEMRRLLHPGTAGIMVGAAAAHCVGASRQAHSNAGARGRESLRAHADRFAAGVRPIIERIQASGVTGLSAIADELNSRGIGSPRGGKWRGSAVRRLLARTLER
jgi:hypothetical protein